MEERLEFRTESISYFKQILIADNYDEEQSAALAFYITKILEDALPLLDKLRARNLEVEEVMNEIHMLFTNQHSFNQGYRTLKRDKEQ